MSGFEGGSGIAVRNRKSLAEIDERIIMEGRDKPYNDS
jgi:hypothetical protein